MTDYGLDDKQAIAIGALIAGHTPADAAAFAGVHPLDIDSWRRKSLPFQKALLDAYYSRPPRQASEEAAHRRRAR